MGLGINISWGTIPPFFSSKHPSVHQPTLPHTQPLFHSLALPRFFFILSSSSLARSGKTSGHPDPLSSATPRCSNALSSWKNQLPMVSLYCFISQHFMGGRRRPFFALSMLFTGFIPSLYSLRNGPLKKASMTRKDSWSKKRLATSLRHERWGDSSCAPSRYTLHPRVLILAIPRVEEPRDWEPGDLRRRSLGPQLGFCALV